MLICVHGYFGYPPNDRTLKPQHSLSQRREHKGLDTEEQGE